jgi:hypothetical protein
MTGIQTNNVNPAICHAARVAASLAPTPVRIAAAAAI